MTSKPRALAHSLAAFTLAAAVCVTGGSVAAAQQPKESKEPSLTGAGRILYRYSPDDDIRFSFDARGNTIEARGTFRYSHEVDGVVYRTEAEVDCLITGGHVATVTGVITETDVPEHLGQRVGVTVEDLGRKDRLGFSWGVSPMPTPRCLGTAPFTHVVGGDYTVVDGPFTIPE
jgi:hypothetical protein